MRFEKDFNNIISHFLEKHGGNKAATAESLGVNPVTFWKWLKKGNPISEALSTAIDNSGAYLILPWEKRAEDNGQGSTEEELSARVLEMEQQIESLTRERAALQGEVRALERMLEKVLAPQSQQSSPPSTQGSLLDDFPKKEAC